MSVRMTGVAIKPGEAGTFIVVDLWTDGFAHTTHEAPTEHATLAAALEDVRTRIEAETDR